jgi:drug/metabolite transporter (DMT)-like permease
MNQNKALIFVAVTAMTWSGTGIFVRLLPPISPFVITSFRLLVAAVLVVPVLLLFRSTRTDLFASLKQPFTYVFGLMLVGYYLCATVAFQLASVAEIALITCTPPLFVLVFKWLAKERIPALHVFGAIIALIGMVVMALPQLTNGVTAVSRLAGYSLGTCTAMFSALYAFFYQRVAAKGKVAESTSITAMAFSLGAVIMGVVSVLYDTGAEPLVVTTTNVGLLVGLGIVSTAIPTLGFSLSSKHLPPLVTSTIPLYIPLIGGTIAYFLLDERLNLSFFIGAIMVLTGVVMVIRPAPDKSNALAVSD